MADFPPFAKHHLYLDGYWIINLFYRDDTQRLNIGFLKSTIKIQSKKKKNTI